MYDEQIEKEVERRLHEELLKREMLNRIETMAKQIADLYSRVSNLEADKRGLKLIKQQMPEDNT